MKGTDMLLCIYQCCRAATSAPAPEVQGPGAGGRIIDNLQIGSPTGTASTKAGPNIRNFELRKKLPVLINKKPFWIIFVFIN